MADDKRARDKQAHDEVRRQQKRDIAMALERGDETKPPIEDEVFADVEEELQSVQFPATGHEVVEAVGDREVESPEGTYTIEELVPDTDVETIESPESVKVRVQRPTIAAATKRVVEASESIRTTDLGESQREAYEKTFRELKAIDADDDDEGIRVISDWIVEQIREKEKLPGSRAVRRRAAKFCRENGYEVRNDEWLGI